MPEQSIARTELREIPLSRIVVPDGFNPRGEVTADAELAALAETIRQRGVLQPVLVRAAEEGEFALIAGERRYRAALDAALGVIPAIVRPPGTGDLDEQAELAADAVIENELRKPLDPVQRARGYAQMRDGGLTVKGIAERLGGISQARVRETLQVLDLPAALHPLVADGTVPQGALKALVKLAKVHTGLPEVAVKRVLTPPLHDWDAPTTWDDLVSDPIATVIGRYDNQAADLPDDVYVAGHAYPVARFELASPVLEDLTELSGLLGDLPPEEFTVRFDRDLTETAAALKAAHASVNGFEHLVVGRDVGAQLAADYIGRCLQVQRDNAERAREAAAAADTPDDARTGAHPEDAPLSEEQRKEQARREREAEKAARQAAHARNELLGAAIVKRMSKVKVDDRVLKVLTAVPLVSDLRSLAERGARYGFPGWVTFTERRDGTSKPEYLDAGAAEAKAREYLAGANGAGEIAGRSLALIAMARWADQDAVARTNRCLHEVRFTGYRDTAERGLPWRAEAADLLDELLLERLPHEAAEPIREAQRVEDERRRREHAAELNARTTSTGEADSEASEVDAAYPEALAA